MKTIKSTLLVFIFLLSGFLNSSNAQWIQVSNGLENPYVVSVAASGNNICAGTYGSGIYLSTNYGTNWNHNCADGSVVPSFSVNGNYIFAASSALGVWQSTNNGFNFTQTSCPVYGALSVLANGNNIFVGSGDGVYVSNNSGMNWTQIPLNDRPANCFAVNGNTIFAGTVNGVYLSTNNGMNWTQTFFNYRNVVSLATIGNNIFAGTANGVYLSTDNGLTWNQTSLNYINVLALTVDGNDIFAGALGGVFVSINNGTTWTERSEGLTNLAVHSLCISNDHIFAGIYGTGVWKRRLFTTLDITAIPEGLYNSVTNELNSEDTLRAYLRNTSAPYDIVDSSKAVIDPVSFTGRFKFLTAQSGNYYIVLKHRNSIETWSKFGGENILQGDTSYSYDFTSSPSQAFGNNMVLKGSKYCIYSGDVDQNGVIDATDNINVKNDVDTFMTGYLNTDVTGDDFTNLSDLIITYNNSVKFVSVKTPLSVSGPSNPRLSAKDEESGNVSLEKFELSDNYPNPFNPTTQISYQIPVEGNVTLKIYDIAGKEVASLVNQRLSAGKYSATFNAGNLSSGTYFYKLDSKGFSQVKKMTLVK